MIAHWLFYITGARHESRTWYGFWSGFGGSIPGFLIARFLLYRNCHVHGCWRLGYLYGHPSVSAADTAAFFAQEIRAPGLDDGDGIALDLKSLTGSRLAR